jgi:hypothetical protein
MNCQLDLDAERQRNGKLYQSQQELYRQLTQLAHENHKQSEELKKAYNIIQLQERLIKEQEDVNRILGARPCHLPSISENLARQIDYTMASPSAIAPNDGIKEDQRHPEAEANPACLLVGTMPTEPASYDFKAEECEYKLSSNAQSPTLAVSAPPDDAHTTGLAQQSYETALPVSRDINEVDMFHTHLGSHQFPVSAMRGPNPSVTRPSSTPSPMPSLDEQLHVTQSGKRKRSGEGKGRKPKPQQLTLNKMIA